MRHTYLFFTLINFSLKKNFENRWNAFGVMFGHLLEIGLIIFFLEAIYSLTDSLYGWEKFEVIALVGLYRVLRSFHSTLFQRSINQIPEYISQGDLDMILTKPINTQFLVSFRYINLYNLIAGAIGILILAYSFSKLNLQVGITDYLILVINTLFGLMIFYSIHLFIATFSFWMGKFQTLPDLFQIIREPLSIPLDFLGRGVTFAVTFIIPLALVVTMPIKIFLGKSSETMTVLIGLFAILFILISAYFWNYAMRHYTSASS